MLELQTPWFLSLIFLPVLVYVLVPAKKKPQSAIQVPQFELLSQVSGITPQQGVIMLKRTKRQKLIVVFGWLCIVVALAKPVWVGEPISREKSARDIMVALDLSGSMIKKDFYSQDDKNITRLQAAQQVLKTFAESRDKDRLGLILFGDAPYLQVPLTEETQTWTDLLEQTSLGIAGWQTAIGLSIQVFSQQKASNPLLVLLSDGNDTVSKMPLLKAAQIAKKHGVKIYTVAMGNPQAEGEYRVDVESLQKIAEITGGKSYLAQDRVELERVYQEIDQLEPQIFETKTYRPRVSLHFVPVALYAFVMVLLLLPLLLRNKRSLPQQKEAHQ
ncbi:VWA domain-containing protein [Vibrio paucivorans]|uniref:VWA domain-containing protein n=1 Tax=Vibrio paucivorans TaxID=2829489 RepID=A0A9X3CC52_9VIBR|nr:VWA domain-containing protein [Vibrio paucivorans]MCW8332624.1 VWA domain-containing protein [Vibrio paucivorans]